MLTLYRQVLHLRRELPAGSESFEWLDSPPGCLAFRRDGLECWLNSGDQTVSLPEGRVALRSTPDVGAGQLPPNAAAWIVDS